MPKNVCTSRAEWRLQTGKPAEALSAHYRLDCDFGTAVIVCWEKGGIEPIYVCGNHAKQLGRSREHGPDARIITSAPEQSDTPIKSEERTRTEEVARTKSNGTASPKAARSQAETKVGRAITDGSARTPLRDLTYGNSAKAMVDEAIWNLATGDFEVYRTGLQQGKPAREAAQAAGGQLAVIHQKIGDYTLKLEGLLSECKTTISVGETVDKPLEQAVLEIIGNGTMGDPEKDAAIQQLGALQESVKHGLQGEMTPLQANQILMEMGERLNWGGSTNLSGELKRGYGALYGSLKAAICSSIPEAQNIQDRLINLYAAKAGMEKELLTTKELA